MYYSQLPSRELLQRIQLAADSLLPLISSTLLHKTGRPPSNRPTFPSTSSASLSTLDLPIPEPITPSLLACGCSEETAIRLSDAYLRSAGRIRDAHTSAFQQLLHQFASDASRVPSRIETAVSLIKAQYHARLRAAEMAVTNQVAKHVVSKRKPVFNQEYVPVLEKYFEHNAYPSAADRAALARKSMMAPRQIEVWFQNHRNRAKKEGRPLHRLDPDTKILNLSLESLKEKIPLLVAPSKEQKYTQLIDEQSDSVLETEVEVSRPLTPEFSCSISMIAPSHAFPTTFPPPCNCVTFPREVEKYIFPRPIWHRRPTTSKPPYAAIDFDEFIEDFNSKLIIRDLSMKKKSSPRTSSDMPPWFAATCTTMSPAPHPALIRLPTLATKPMIIPLRSVPAPASRRFLFRSPSRSSKTPPLTLGLSDQMPTRRKIVGLPRRTPKYASISYQQPHRCISPACSEVSSSSSPQSPSADSRASSFGSKVLVSSERRNSSSSSIPSSSSSECLLLTPPPLITTLPGENTSLMSKSTSTFDFDSLFGDGYDENTF